MTTALYTDAGSVVASLAFQSPETIQTPLSIGATSLSVSQTPPIDWQVGTTLILDANNPTLRETVTITATTDGNTVSITPTVNAHVAGAPVVNGTIVARYPSVASRWFDSMTYMKAGFAYEAVTETKEGYVNNAGLIVIPLSKPIVVIGDVTNVTFQSTPMDVPQTIDLTQAWIRDKYFFEAMSPFPPSMYRNGGLVTVSYKGGYSTLPDDIVNAVTVMAARFYKERDSGYSDAIGNTDLGIISYKKAMPADVAAVVQAYRRWTE